MADGGGLYLLVKTNGSRYWRLKYRIDGKEKLLALGVYPDVSLAHARAKRDEARKGIAGGIDPLELKKEQKAERVVRRTTQKAAQVLNRVKKQYHKEPIKTYTKSSFNSRGSKLSSGSIGRILDHAETANAATNKFRLKSGSRVNSGATKLEEMRYRLGIKNSYSF